MIWHSKPVILVCSRLLANAGELFIATGTPKNKKIDRHTDAYLSCVECELKTCSFVLVNSTES